MPVPFPFVTSAVLLASELNSITELPINNKSGSYTLVAGDAGEYVVMESASATTITVPASVFTASQIVYIVNKGTASTVVTAGVGTTVSTSGSLTVPANGAGRLLALSASAFIFESSGSTSGLAVVKSETSFLGSSSVIADGVFTSTYTNYRVDMRYETSGSGNELRLRLRTGGTSTSTSTYNLQQIIFDHTTSYSQRASSQTSFVWSGQTNGSFVSAVTGTIFGPQLTSPTQFVCNNAPNQGAYTTPQAGQNSGNQSSSTSFDGIEFFPTSGTITGTYTIYGLAKS